MHILFIGDIIGTPGIAMFQKWAPRLRELHRADAIVVNGENGMKNGMGLNAKVVDQLREAGAALVTTGNHVWDQKDFYAALNERDDVIRPEIGRAHV